MKWMRYQHKWAWGITKQYEWVEFDETSFKAEDEKSVHDFIREMELCKEGEWSEKYRGIDYEFFDKPDDAWLLQEIKETQARIKSLQNYENKLEGLLEAESRLTLAIERAAAKGLVDQVKDLSE